MNALRATDETHGSHAVAEAVDPPVSRLTKGCMIGQAEIVVRAEIDDFVLARTDSAALRARQDSLALVQTLFSERGQVGAQSFDESFFHVLNYTRAPWTIPQETESIAGCSSCVSSSRAPSQRRRSPAAEFTSTAHA